MRFFEAAANWADRKAVDLKFARDEYDGWFAILSFSDARGPFSTTVNAIAPLSAKKESAAQFEERVANMLTKATVQARAARIRAVTRSEIRAAA